MIKKSIFYKPNSNRFTLSSVMKKGQQLISPSDCIVKQLITLLIFYRSFSLQSAYKFNLSDLGLLCAFKRDRSISFGGSMACGINKDSPVCISVSSLSLYKWLPLVEVSSLLLSKKYYRWWHFLYFPKRFRRHKRISAP